MNPAAVDIQPVRGFITPSPSPRSARNIFPARV